MSGYGMIDMVAYIGQSFPNEAARHQRRVWVFCRIQNVESCQGVICGKSSAERSANYYPLLHSTAEKSAFPLIAKQPFPHIVQHMCNRCIAAIQCPAVSSFRILCGPFAKEQGTFFTILINFKVSSTLQQVSYHFTGRYDWLQFV